MHSLGTGVLRSGLRKAGTWRSSRPGGQLGCSSLKCCFFPLGSNHSHLSTLLFVGPQTSTFLPKERKKLNHLQLHIQRLHSMNLASTAPGAPGHPRQVPPGADAPKTSMPTKASASGLAEGRSRDVGDVVGNHHENQEAKREREACF